MLKVTDAHDISRSTRWVGILFRLDQGVSIQNRRQWVGINPDRRQDLVFHIVKVVKDKVLLLPY